MGKLCSCVDDPNCDHKCAIGKDSVGGLVCISSTHIDGGLHCEVKETISLSDGTTIELRTFDD